MNVVREFAGPDPTNEDIKKSFTSVSIRFSKNSCTRSDRLEREIQVLRPLCRSVSGIDEVS